MDGRRIGVDVKYNNQSITADIEHFITDLSFTDNLSGQADDFSISLGDRERRWMNSWKPKKGASMDVALLISAYWNTTASSKRKIGYFEIDDINVSGPPNKVSVKGISIPESTALRSKNKYRSWQKVKLNKVASDIAKWNKMRFYFSGDENPYYDRIEQQGETDLAFLMRICEESGFALKVANKTISVFDEHKFEKTPAIGTIKRTDQNVKDYSGNDTLSSIYKACTISYTVPKSKKTYKYTFTPAKAPPTNKVLIANDEAKSKDEAKRLAIKNLRAANKEATTFSIRLRGYENYFAGQTVNLKEFGGFDGKYLIKSVAVKVGSNSETSLELRKCLEGY